MNVNIGKHLDREAMESSIGFLLIVSLCNWLPNLRIRRIVVIINALVLMTMSTISHRKFFMIMPTGFAMSNVVK